MTAVLELPDDHIYWRREAQEQLLAKLETGASRVWHPFYCPNPGCNGQPHVWPVDTRDCPRKYGHEWERDKGGTEELILNDKGAARCYHCGVLGAPLDDWTFPHARPDQRPPRWSGRWSTLFVRSGRGTGKTRMGSEMTNQVAKRYAGRITLIGATGPDIRTTMVEGESGILACAPADFKPHWEPSKKQLTWPNGAIAIGYSAEEPDRLRGQNSSFVWGDEPAHWALVDACWKNMLFGLRKGKHPKVIATSTPKATPWVREQIANPLTIDRRVPTDLNLTNLSEMYQHTVIDPMRGTRLGQQELEGDVLEDVEGALWQWDWIRYVHPDTVPHIKRLVVAVDPAGTANKRSDETGIIAVGLGEDGHIYVLADWTGKFSPETWGRRVLDLAERLQADAVVFEKNYGGDMVRRVLDAEVELRGNSYLAPGLREVTSRRGKEIRAEPISQLYEKKRVHHVGPRNAFDKLDTELTTWVPGVSPSPNRLDALVHGVTHLRKGGGTWAVASPTELDRAS